MAVSNRDGLSIERWLPESLCRHEYEIRAGHSTWVKEVFNPDAFIRMEQMYPAVYQNYFLEVDLGHTNSRQFINKLLTHQRYLESGLFASMFGCDDFKTLVITTSTGRLRNLLSLVETRGSNLYWFTTFDSIDAHGLLTKIWRAPQSTDFISLL